VGSQTRIPPEPPARIGPLRPGDPRRVGGYRLTGLLGEGGMGQVFLGRSRAGRMVAVKLIRPEYARQPTFRERFAREVAAARMVGGFHAVQVVDADPRAERPWMVTAYIPAPSLQDRVDTAGPLGTARVAELAAHLAEGLAAIHACGLVHRDLKPSNVLLAADGARIIDFGIARAVGAVTLTTAGTMLGTCLYMSPEQMREAGLTAASDIFSLGSVLAFAATGAPPFRATTLPGIVRDITDGAPDLADVPEPLVPLITACLAKKPAARPSLDDILKRCATLIRPAPPRKPAPSRSPAPPRKPAPPRSPGPPRKPVPPPRPEPSRKPEPAQDPEPVRRPAPPASGPVPRRVLLAGGAAAIVAAGAAFPLQFLASRSPGRPAGASTPAGASARARRGSQVRSGAAPPPIRRVLVPGPSGPAGSGPGRAVLSPNGSTVAYTTSDPGGAKVWLLDASDMQVAASIALGHGASAVVFGPDSRSLAGLGFGGQPDAMRIWRLEAVGTTALNLVTSAPVPRAPRALGAMAFSPDGRTLAVSGTTGLSLLDAATLRTIRSVAAPPGVSGAPVYRPDGQVLAVGGAPGSLDGGSLGGGSPGAAVCLLDAATLGTITRLSVPALPAYSLTFSPDGRTLALTGCGPSAGGSVRLLDAASLRTKAVGVLPGGTGVTAAAAAGFTPDGAVLAGYSLAGRAVAWLMQVSTMKIIASTPVGPAGDATRLAVDLSADGETLMAAYTSNRTPAGRIQLYRIEPG
jgi:serine/threonine protein kinase/WD40 repeat protein